MAGLHQPRMKLSVSANRTFNCQSIFAIQTLLCFLIGWQQNMLCQFGEQACPLPSKTAMWLVRNCFYFSDWFMSMLSGISDITTVANTVSFRGTNPANLYCIFGNLMTVSCFLIFQPPALALHLDFQPQTNLRCITINISRYHTNQFPWKSHTPHLWMCYAVMWWWSKSNH